MPPQRSADVIRTPDQRLRVFVSSTLTDLAAAVAQQMDAEAHRLAFEAGAELPMRDALTLISADEPALRRHREADPVGPIRAASSHPT